MGHLIHLLIQMYFVDITNREHGCKIIPSHLPYGMQCRCIDQGLSGCNVSTTPGSNDVVEWKCAARFGESLQYSDVSQIRSQAKPTDAISRETKKVILEIRKEMIYTRENEPVSLNCSNGITEYTMRELQNVYWYTKNGERETHLTRSQLKTNHNGESVLNASFTRGENGSIVYCKHDAQTIAQWTIFVLYPPTVVDEYMEIAENATIRQEYNFIPGNPQTTYIRWSKGHLLLPHQQLEITHINRHDAGNYTCEATNRFDRDGIVYDGNDTGTLRLIVFYPTAVTRFYINDMFEEKQVTLVETGNGTIHCFGEGNPAPTLTLIKYFADNKSNETLYTVNSTHLRYEISSVGSHHSGKYACVTSNRFGEELRMLHLNIKELHEIATIMQVFLVTRNETSVDLRWILDDDALFHLVQNKTCYVLYKNSDETEWIDVISDIIMKLTLTSLMLDLRLTNLRPDTQYEAQLIARLPSGNYSIAPKVTFKTLSFSKATGIDVVVAPIVCSVLIICVGVILRAYMKRSLRSKAQEDIDNIRVDATISRSTMDAVVNADDDDNYDCIDMTRTQSCINPQDDRSGHFESVHPQIIGGTNQRDAICLQTQTTNKVDYDFLDRTGNPTEKQYNSMGEVVEGDMDEYIIGCCHSSSSDTDSVISDSCLQYLTVIGNLPIPPESVSTSAYDDVANTSRDPHS